LDRGEPRGMAPGLAYPNEHPMMRLRWMKRP